MRNSVILFKAQHVCSSSVCRAVNCEWARDSEMNNGYGENQFPKLVRENAT